MLRRTLQGEYSELDLKNSSFKVSYLIVHHINSYFVDVFVYNKTPHNSNVNRALFFCMLHITKVNEAIGPDWSDITLD